MFAGSRVGITAGAASSTMLKQVKWRLTSVLQDATTSTHCFIIQNTTLVISRPEKEKNLNEQSIKELMFNFLSPLPK